MWTKPEVTEMRFGFEVTSERRHYYQDNGEDALLMGLYDLNEDRLKHLLALGGGLAPSKEGRKE